MGQKRGVLEEGKLFQEFRCIHSFIHSFIHPSIHHFIHSFILSIIHALIKPFLCSFFHFFIHSSFQLLSVFPFIHSMSSSIFFLGFTHSALIFLSEKNAFMTFQFILKYLWLHGWLVWCFLKELDSFIDWFMTELLWRTQVQEMKDFISDKKRLVREDSFKVSLD